MCSISNKMTTLITNNNIVFIQPRWLTMIHGSGECQICNTPEGDTRTYYLNIRYNCNDKFGFLVCTKNECNLLIKSAYTFTESGSPATIKRS